VRTRKKRTVEERVGDQAARVDDFAVGRVGGFAVTAVDGAVRDRLAHQLIRVDRLDVATVVLIVVGDWSGGGKGQPKEENGKEPGRGLYVCST
jgi:hypothetical protein